MALEWLPRDDEIRNHALFGNEHWGTQAPCTIYEKRPLTGPDGKKVDGLFAAWITLNNPAQYNSYTTAMAKGVIAGFQNASLDRTVVAVVFTAAGDRAFCTGGNTKEYAEYYSMRPNEYGEYMDIFNQMIDSILMCKKPVICRANGMRIGGGQEVGPAADITLSSDMAIYGQAGPRHGSSPDGGASDFLPWFMGVENAMWSVVSCEQWSAYKMKRLGMITKALPILKVDSKFVRNPTVITDKYVEDGEIVFGEPKTGDDLKKGQELVAKATTDFSQLDAEVNRVVWTMANLFPGCVIKAIDSVRAKKRFFWDMAKDYNRHWLAANMMGEAFLGFQAFNTRRLTGKDTIDFIKYRQLVAQGAFMDRELFDQVMPQPKK